MTAMHSAQSLAIPSFSPFPTYFTRSECNSTSTTNPRLCHWSQTLNPLLFDQKRFFFFKGRKLLEYTPGNNTLGNNQGCSRTFPLAIWQTPKQSPNLIKMPLFLSSTMWHTGICVLSVTTTPASQLCKHVSCFLLIHWLPSMFSLKDGLSISLARCNQSWNVCMLSRSCSHPDRQIRWNVGEHAIHSLRGQWNSKREFHYTPV